MSNFVNKIQDGKNRIDTSPLIKNDKYADNTIFAIIPFPGAFTPICGSELPQYDRLKNQLELLNATICFVSTDTVETLIKYTTPGETENNLPAVGNLNYPIYSDEGKKILDAIGLIDAETGLAARGIMVYTFNPDGSKKIIQHEGRHRNISRNIGDLLTIIRAYRFIEQNDGHCMPEMYQELETLAYYTGSTNVGVEDVNSAREYSGSTPIDPAIKYQK